jgi:predicted nucleic acid-binding Zn ribbon protein
VSDAPEGWRPPRRLGENLDRALHDLAGGRRRGADEPLRGAREVFSRWEELVGAAVAANARPLRFRDDRLVLVVADPVWASELRWLEDDLCRRIAEAGGPVLAGIDVRVRP